jgi:amidase
VGGQCQSAYVPFDYTPNIPDLGHFSPGGSSVGSAVAVSAGYAPISISTEADGSTTLPGSRAALYGLVMTRETISLDGYFAISTTYASPGCMAKTATDLIEVTRVMLEASNAKAKTNLPSAAESKRGWEGITLGFANHDYAPISASDIGLTELEILELVRSSSPRKYPLC